MNFLRKTRNFNLSIRKCLNLNVSLFNSNENTKKFFGSSAHNNQEKEDEINQHNKTVDKIQEEKPHHTHHTHHTHSQSKKNSINKNDISSLNHKEISNYGLSSKSNKDFDLEGEVFPNINTSSTKDSIDYDNPYHNKKTHITKVYGNMAGMDRIDGDTGGITEEISKDFLKDESKAKERSSKGIFIYSGNLNTESLPSEKDITDETKKVK